MQFRNIYTLHVSRYRLTTSEFQDINALSQPVCCRSMILRLLMKHAMTVSGLCSQSVRTPHDTMAREKKLEIFYLFVYF